MLITVNVLCLTGPPPPQNITVGLIAVSQISVQWMLTASKSKVGWAFSVRYADMSTKEERIIGMTNISRLSETNGLQSYTAVIGGLESYRKYTVEVYTVTQRGIESSGQTPVTVRTGKHVASLHGRKSTGVTYNSWLECELHRHQNHSVEHSVWIESWFSQGSNFLSNQQKNPTYKGNKYIFAFHLEGISEGCSGLNIQAYILLVSQSQSKNQQTWRTSKKRPYLSMSCISDLLEKQDLSYGWLTTSW